MARDACKLNLYILCHYCGRTQLVRDVEIHFKVAECECCGRAVALVVNTRCKRCGKLIDGEIAH